MSHDICPAVALMSVQGNPYRTLGLLFHVTASSSLSRDGAPRAILEMIGRALGVPNRSVEPGVGDRGIRWDATEVELHQPAQRAGFIA